VPSEPRNAEVIPGTPTSVKVSWETPTQTKGRLLNYAVFYYVDGAVSMKTMKLVVISIYLIIHLSF